MDTMHVPEGDKELNDSLSEAPSPARLWVSQLIAALLLAMGVYAVARGALEYRASADEGKQLRTSLTEADLSLTHLGSSGERAGADWGASVRLWRDKNAERYGVVRLHLLGCYALLLLGPVSLLFALVIWWRGQFPRPKPGFPLDAVQIAMGAAAVVLLAGLRIWDAATLTVMGKTPLVPTLQTFLKTPTNEQKAQHLASMRSDFEKTLQQFQDKRSTPMTRAAGARSVSAAVWDKQFVATLGDADKESFRATLKELVKKSYTEDDSCPVLIRAIAALGDSAGADALETEREKTRPNWVDVKKPEGLRCFFNAVAAGRDADVRKLIERGVNVNLISPIERHVALHEAVLRRQLTVAELLLDKGAKVNVPGELPGREMEKEYPLHRAVGDTKLVKLLLDKGADPNALDYRGMTPLHVAAAAGDTASAELLLAKKAKLNALDFSKRTPLDLAASKSLASMRNLLVQRGGVTSAQLQSKNSSEAAISPNAR